MGQDSTTNVLGIPAGGWLGNREALPKKDPRWGEGWSLPEKMEPRGSGYPWPDIWGGCHWSTCPKALQCVYRLSDEQRGTVN